MKHYQTIYADPPWPIKWQGSASIGTKPLQYRTMTIAQLCALPVKEIADDLSNLYLWTTNQFLPEALGIVQFWGFQYRMLWTWCKNNGIGGHPRNATEHLIIASRGATKSIGRHEKATLNWLASPTSKHSQKPHKFRELIERFSPEPRIELFARTRVDNWDCWGDEVASDINLASLKSNTKTGTFELLPNLQQLEEE
ncbi:MAG: methyltransferase [Deltaproteobacteria bacterium]|nr:methyltransferase [Deltaproteobacteria bacterium]